MDIIFVTKDANDGNITQGYGVEFEFNKYSQDSHNNRKMIGWMLGYVEKIQDITQVDFSSFQCIIFRCRWWDTFYMTNVKEYRDIGLICINSRKMWDESKEPYVFPKHCNQVLFYLDVLDRDWWFILIHNSISKHIFETNAFMPSGEHNQGDDNKE